MPDTVGVKDGVCELELVHDCVCVDVTDGVFDGVELDEAVVVIVPDGEEPEDDDAVGVAVFDVVPEVVVVAESVLEGDLVPLGVNETTAPTVGVAEGDEGGAEIARTALFALSATKMIPQPTPTPRGVSNSAEVGTPFGPFPEFNPVMPPPANTATVPDDVETERIA